MRELPEVFLEIQARTIEGTNRMLELSQIEAEDKNHPTNSEDVLDCLKI